MHTCTILIHILAVSCAQIYYMYTYPPTDKSVPLVQVECGLQSQLLARSEAESRRLSEQLVTVERLLADERASHIRDRETLVLVAHVMHSTSNMYIEHRKKEESYMCSPKYFL